MINHLHVHIIPKDEKNPITQDQIYSKLEEFDDNFITTLADSNPTS